MSYFSERRASTVPCLSRDSLSPHAVTLLLAGVFCNLTLPGPTPTHHLSANFTTPSPGRSSIAAATTTPAMLACTRRSPSPAVAGRPDTLTAVGRLSKENATRGSPPPPGVLPRPPAESAPFPLPLHYHTAIDLPSLEYHHRDTSLKYHH